MQLVRVEYHPGKNSDGLTDDVLGGAEEPRGRLCQPTECVVAERTPQLMSAPLQLVDDSRRTVRCCHEAVFSTVRRAPPGPVRSTLAWASVPG
jgi:hypothetical protein